MNLFIELNCNPQKVLRLYPDMLPRVMQNAQHKQPVKLEGFAERASLQGLIMYLNAVRDPECEGGTNLRDDYDTTEDLNEIIDTSLLRACIKVNDPVIYELLSNKNRCNLKESIKMLTSAEVSILFLVLIF